MATKNKLKGKTFVFLGRSGAGKSKQTEYLTEYLKEQELDFLQISTGGLGRELSQQKTVIGKWIRSILDRGDFFPDWMAIHIWLSYLEKKLVDVDQIVVFEGTPRKMAEAKMVDELMKYLGRELPTPIYLDIDDDEAMKRLLRRARTDDTVKVIKNRLDNFKKNVLPIVTKYYKKRALKIDGTGTKLEVWERIKATLSS